MFSWDVALTPSWQSLSSKCPRVPYDRTPSEVPCPSQSCFGDLRGTNTISCKWFECGQLVNIFKHWAIDLHKVNHVAIHKLQVEFYLTEISSSDKDHTVYVLNDISMDKLYKATKQPQAILHLFKCKFTHFDSFSADGVNASRPLASLAWPVLTVMNLHAHYFKRFGRDHIRYERRTMLSPHRAML